ncbi:hypothetical protein BUALT_Bualt10G0044000 [Buddleja alternifolia]|uniref:Stress-response A/B barrel domain-containing protein n=1 Tax=Buddleja alternifolia TaxID=168488 RepID=A0AAV6X6Y7_9LAMI|nr:hypothetical protein BUALT_Bualt10G0044000 [Buddleja alternifolia]
MLILNKILTPCALPRYTPLKGLPFSGLPTKKCWRRGFSFLVDSRGSLRNWEKEEKSVVVVSAIDQGSLGTDVQRKRKIVEHISLLKAKEDLSEEQEKDMLDYLYTTQYQMRGIVAISLGDLYYSRYGIIGRISDPNPEQYTHAIFMRFQTKEDLAKFYENPFYMRVLEEKVTPYCHGVFNLDYDSEVEDDILAIFRKGEEFNYGVELMLLLAFVTSSLGGPAEDAMTSLSNLTLEFPSLIVQATKAIILSLCFSRSKYEYEQYGIYSCGAEAFKIFMNSSEYTTMWKSKFQPIIQKALSVCYSVDPVGKDLMISHSMSARDENVFFS